MLGSRPLWVDTANQMAAAAALANTVALVTVLDTNLKPHTGKQLRRTWQADRQHVMKTLLARLTRTTDVPKLRSRIGPTHATHSHVLQRPLSARCGEGLSVPRCNSKQSTQYKHFPQLYRPHVPLYPVLFLDDDVMVSTEHVFECL